VRASIPLRVSKKTFVGGNGLRSSLHETATNDQERAGIKISSAFPAKGRKREWTHPNSEKLERIDDPREELRTKKDRRRSGEGREVEVSSTLSVHSLLSLVPSLTLGLTRTCQRMKIRTTCTYDEHQSAEKGGKERKREERT